MEILKAGVLIFNFIMAIIICCMIFYIAFDSISIKSKSKNSNFKVSDTESMHCFECEIEMPVKVKNGHIYCKNCGLHH